MFHLMCSDHLLGDVIYCNRTLESINLSKVLLGYIVLSGISKQIALINNLATDQLN